MREVTVSVIEPLGDRMDVYGQTSNGDQIVCRLDARDNGKKDAVREGMVLTLHLDMRRVHFFEPGETGVNVRYGGNVVECTSVHPSVPVMLSN